MEDIIDYAEEVDVSSAETEIEPEPERPSSAIAIRPVSIPVAPGESYAERLASVEGAIAIMERRNALFETARAAAIKRTRPGDWVLTKPKGVDSIDGCPAMLKASGARLIAEVYGVRLSNVRPLDNMGCFAPAMVPEDDGTMTLRAWGDGECALNGNRVESIEASINGTEDFIGRKSAGTHQVPEQITRNDMRSSLRTRLYTKAVIELCGIKGMKAGELRQYGLDVEQCEKGPGFSQADRDPDAADAAAELRSEIEKRSSDPRERMRILMESTSFIGKDGKKFDGHKSYDRVSAKAAEIAIRKVKASYPLPG